MRFKENKVLKSGKLQDQNTSWESNWAGEKPHGVHNFAMNWNTIQISTEDFVALECYCKNQIIFLSINLGKPWVKGVGFVVRPVGRNESIVQSLLPQPVARRAGCSTPPCPTSACGCLLWSDQASVSCVWPDLSSTAIQQQFSPEFPALFHPWEEQRDPEEWRRGIWADILGKHHHKANYTATLKEIKGNKLKRQT